MTEFKRYEATLVQRNDGPPTLLPVSDGPYVLLSDVGHLIETLESALRVECKLRFAACPGCTKGIVWGPRDAWACSDPACGLEGTARHFLVNGALSCPNCCGDLAEPTALVKDAVGRVRCLVCKWPKHEPPPIIARVDVADNSTVCPKCHREMDTGIAMEKEIAACICWRETP